ncbi:membrane protein [Saccharothrix violaceirubra]|uniref:Heparin binding hemagglutinin HbhA n=1 Tax=Saccharothrix violaceirubra TaxID=413306 RepID=A0A7W7SXF9_9PSEU|nr:hypothetical protein [Saccharothrix violaceirubra]MBB4962721.1 heparin binding hemagglutinin HbhA [Saccharothrix violaceirubra]
MSKLPNAEELRKAGEQVAAAARTPLLAALGAGDLAAKAVIDALGKARERVESTQATDLRDKFDPAELRKVVDAYTQSAVNLFQFLAEQGEQTLEKLKNRPELQKAISQVEEVVGTVQKRTEEAASEARDLADDVLGKVTRRTREAGEKVADDVDTVSERVAEAVVDAGGEVAEEVRTTARRATRSRKAAE